MISVWKIRFAIHAGMIIVTTFVLASCAARKPPPRRTPGRVKAGTVGPGSDRVEAVRPIVEEEAEKNSVPEDLVFGVIYVESRFNHRAVSHVGARGLMQLMPGTARYLAGLMGKRRYDSFDPQFNIEAGTFYLAKLLKNFDGDETLALASYNAGAGNVRKWMKRRGRLPGEVRNYARAVQAARLRFRGASSSKPEYQTDSFDREGLASLIRKKNREAIEQAERDNLQELISDLESHDFQKHRPDQIEDVEDSD